MSAAPAFRTVAVLGSGIMGAGIAGLMADLGLDVQLYDLEQAIAERALAKLADPKAKPPLLMSRRSARRIRPLALGAIPAELPKADLVIEAVPEVLKIKRSTFDQVEAAIHERAIVASNTSGLSIAAMAEGRSESFRRRFLGMHFFNPVRFMALVELIPGADTAPEVLEGCRALLVRAGKTPVVGRDTPSFIANRIGIFSMMRMLQIATEKGLPLEAADLVSGPPIGFPKTGTFRLADLVGLDTLCHVAKNTYEQCPDDEARDVFKVPPILERLVQEKRLGDKSGQGFFRKGVSPSGERIFEAIDLATGEYRAPVEVRSEAVKATRKIADAAARLRALARFEGDDPLCDVARELVVSTGAYALRRVGEIADDAATIDLAVRKGFTRDLGPIEALDAIGLEHARALMERFGVAVPPALDEAIAAGRPLAPRAGPRPGEIDLGALRADASTLVRESASARLHDLGDGVLGCELASALVPHMNPVDDGMIAMLEAAHEEIGAGRFRALVIGNQAANFSAGANLHLILELAKQGRFDAIREIARRLQEVNLANLFAPFPVVTAPHGMTLGGGLEIAMGGQVRVAHAELYCGLVEVGVGVVPAGGGCYFLLRQLIERAKKRNPGPMPPVAQAFELIGFGTVSTSAFDAQEKGLLAPHDEVVFAKDEQIARAKAAALARLEGFEPFAKEPLLLPGEGGRLALEDRIAGMLALGQISAHAARIAGIQARILTGGDRAHPARPVTPEEILELEREAFVELCATPATQERMAHMLKTGKPLMN